MAGDNRTEKPTPRRRQKAREKGQVARSREVASGVATLAALGFLAWQAAGFAAEWRALFRRLLATAASGEIGFQIPFLTWSGVVVVHGAAAAGLASWALATASSLAQGGLVLAPTALAPNLERMNPAAKLKRLFSLNALGSLLKSLLPATAMVYLAASILARDWPLVLGLPHRSAAALLTFILSRAFEVAWKSGLVLLVWSSIDYLLERRRLERDLRMSRQEIVEEYKETEGQPAVKARIRRLQRQVRRRRMLRDVERAAVVITNPSEFAIALEYRAEMAAPVLVAKGRNLLAQQIKQVAQWQGIPLVENPPLAHALYRAVEVGQSIPPKLYTVVAEVLAWVWRAQARMQAAGGRG
jgi:flagellar biosynthetic protein FlhB